MLILTHTLTINNVIVQRLRNDTELESILRCIQRYALRFINFIEGTTLCIACASGNEIPLRLGYYSHIYPNQDRTETPVFRVKKPPGSTFDLTHALLVDSRSI